MSRSRKGLQPEACGLCNRLVPQEEIFISQVEGLRGLRVCSQHGRFTTAPSYNDLKRYGSRLPYADTSRRQPVGDANALALYTDDGPEFG